MNHFGVLQDLLTTIVTHGSRLSIPGLEWRPGLHKVSSLMDLAELVLNTRGEASALVHADHLLQTYETSTSEEKHQFFEFLLQSCDLDAEALAKAAHAYQQERSTEHFRKLHSATEPRRQELFRRLNATRRGTVRLVKMRADLVKLMKAHPELEPVDLDLRYLFRSWFNRGFLIMQPIDWNTPANILEKIIAYEAVHEISSWSQLRLRLEPSDRRCFAFFHPTMPEEPLIFVQVALCESIPDNIATVLSSERQPLAAEQANVAAFYSISNCQKGLVGISFGSFLIKQVAQELRTRLPNLKDFVTLSPVPGLMRWLTEQAKNNEGSESNEAKEILEYLANPQWHEDEAQTTRLKEKLVPRAAEYLAQARNDHGQPLDPVARFHLGNGARLERINFPADLSVRGLERAGSVMVNYYYDLTKAEQYHEAYAEDYTVQMSKAVSRLLPSPKASVPQTLI